MTVSSRVAIDVGGTFTDVVTFNSANGGLRFDKVPTTPSDPQQGVINGFAAVAADQAFRRKTQKQMRELSFI